jgi:putative SOS response-associated peptidase YedK
MLDMIPHAVGIWLAPVGPACHDGREVSAVCGRYASTKNPATLAAEFDAVDTTGEDAPRPDFNVAPTKQVISVVNRHPRDDQGRADPDRTERSLRVMRWGLIPHWAKSKSIGSKMINARADTVGSKPAFRTSLAKRRCLLPADGWFEWRRDASGRQPFFMTRGGGASLAMAGLWSTWRDPSADADAPPLVTCAVLTTDAVGQLAGIHDRMPLLLAPSAWAEWLDPDRASVDDLLGEPDRALIDMLELRPVSDAVNSVRNNGPELLKEVAPAVHLDDPALFDVPKA